MHRIIKASFKGCPIEERKLFKKSKCLIPISVGQKVHESEKLMAAITLINRSFKECSILIDDTIQRHTMRIKNYEASEDYYYKEALKEGDNWLKRNINIIKELTIPYNIIRWDDWLNHPDYLRYYEIVKNTRLSNLDYQDAFNDTISEFLTRYLKNNNTINFNKEISFELCLKYLIEECAVMCLWPSGGYDYELYPSGRNTAMAVTYSLLIKPNYPDLLKSVGLRFKKYIKIEGEIMTEEKMSVV